MQIVCIHSLYIHSVQYILTEIDTYLEFHLKNGPSAQHHHPQESKWANGGHAVGEEDNSKQLSTHAKKNKINTTIKEEKETSNTDGDFDYKDGSMCS